MTLKTVRACMVDPETMLCAMGVEPYAKPHAIQSVTTKHRHTTIVCANGSEMEWRMDDLVHVEMIETTPDVTEDVIVIKVPPYPGNEVLRGALLKLAREPFLYSPVADAIRSALAEPLGATRPGVRTQGERHADGAHLFIGPTVAVERCRCVDPECQE